MTSAHTLYSPDGFGEAAEASSPFSGFRRSIARRRPRPKPDPVDQRIRQLVDLVVEERLEEYQKRQQSASAPAPSALDTARTRGASYMKTELDRPENLTLAEASAYCGRSDRVVNEARQRGDYYALVMDGNSRGFRYPRWQFDAAPGRLTTILRKLDTMQLSCWAKHHFLTRPSPFLSGRIPQQLILDGSADLGAVCRAIDEHFAGDQGAA